MRKINGIPTYLGPNELLSFVVRAAEFVIRGRKDKALYKIRKINCEGDLGAAKFSLVKEYKRSNGEMKKRGVVRYQNCDVECFGHSLDSGRSLNCLEFVRDEFKKVDAGIEVSFDDDGSLILR